MAPPKVSFEFFPPKTLPASFQLWDTVNHLNGLRPRFVSVTYGACGNTRELTRDTVKALTRIPKLPIAAHLTCVGESREATLGKLQEYKAAGIKDIVALRGDPPKNQTRFHPHPNGFADSCELIQAIREIGSFNIRVGAYPEKHPEAQNLQQDVQWLKKKFQAGASEAISQFFFDAENFLRFRDACEKAGITNPITPGILPIENWENTKRFAARCGTRIPATLDSSFQKAKRDGRERLLSIAVATELCSKLIDEGIEQLHFYTLNQPDLTREICSALGVVPEAEIRRVA